jgi:hypothetical protein
MAQVEGDMQDDISDEEYEATLDRMCADWERMIRDQGRAQGTRSNIVVLYEVRFGAVPEDLRTALTHIRDEDALRRILIVTGTRTAKDVSAAVRKASSALRLVELARPSGGLA